MSITISNSLPESEWQDFIDQQPESNIFHTPEMFRVFSRAKGYQPELWAALVDGRIAVLFLPVRITLVNNLLRIFTTRAVVFGGILFNAKQDVTEALRQLLTEYLSKTKNGPLFTELRNAYDIQAIRPVLNEFGFVFEDHLNYLIDLGMPLQELFRTISKNGRKAITRSMHRGVTVEEISDHACLSEYYSLLQHTFKRARITLSDISLFEAVYDILVPKGMAKMYLARVDKNIAAVSCELPYKDKIFSWFSGFDLEYRRAYPNDYLVWNILQWGSENGYRLFDFGGAGRPNQQYGPRDFKSKFGGKLVNYGRDVCVHSSLRMTLGRVGYQIYRMIL